MNDNRKAVLACIDGSTYKRGVVDYAAWVSGALGAPLKLLHNIEARDHLPMSDLSGMLGLGTREALLEELVSMEEKRSRILLEQGQLMLDNARQRALAQGAGDVTSIQRHDSLVDALVDLEDDIGILVLGIRGETHSERQPPPSAWLETAIRALHRPVLVVNRDFSAPPRRCMVAYDGSDGARKALAMVAGNPLFRAMECHLVQVDKAGQPALLEDAAATLREAGLDVVAAALHGDAEQQLGNYQRRHGIELTVMGAFGHSRLRELLFGSLTYRMLAGAQTPLLLLR